MDQRLRQELLSMVAEDARVRDDLAKSGKLFEGYHSKMEEVHLKNAYRLDELINEFGWPGRSLVGKDGAEAAWLIVQHAISLPDFSRKCLKLIEEAVAKAETEAYQFAFLHDRIAFFAGRAQRYGTQSDWNKDGKMQVWKLEDKEKVNLYRAEVGLEPLEAFELDAAEIGERAPDDFHERQSEFAAWARRVGWR